MEVGELVGLVLLVSFGLVLSALAHAVMLVYVMILKVEHEALKKEFDRHMIGHVVEEEEEE